MIDDHQNTGLGRETAIRDKGEAAFREASDAAKGALQQGQAKAEALIDEQKSNLAQQVKSFAEVSRNAANELREREQSLAADWVESAAGGAERLANQFRDSDLRGIYNEVSDFARRQPAVFIAGTALLGFAAARFASASAKRNHTAQRGYTPQSAQSQNLASPHVATHRNELSPLAGDEMLSGQPQRGDLY